MQSDRLKEIYAGHKFEGKIVFITGASAGIGAATAMAFAAQGARLLLAARRAGKLAEVASRALECGAQAVHSFDLDVRNRHAVQRAIDDLPAEWAEIDVLVNNAGLSRGMEKLYTGKFEDWDEMIDTNMKGLLYVTRAVVPGMVVRSRGHVVNLGSMAGEIVYPNGAVYCGSKAAVRPSTTACARICWERRCGSPASIRAGGDRVQPGALPRRHGTRGQGLSRAHAAHGRRYCRCDSVGSYAAGAREHCAHLADHSQSGQYPPGSSRRVEPTSN